MFIIFTGNGKGKTTAAIGQALRAIGNGSRVLMIQFIKGPWKSGEHESAAKLSPQFKIVRKGNGFVHPEDSEKVLGEHIKAARSALEYAKKEISSGEWNIVILDELWVALNLKLLRSEDVSDLLDNYLGKLDHLIATGRNCPLEFIERADLVTEMKEIRHPFSKGIPAQAGVEF